MQTTHITIVTRLAVLLLTALTMQHTVAAPSAGDRPPNIILIFTDDQGWADVGVYGAEGFRTLIDWLTRG